MNKQVEAAYETRMTALEEQARAQGGLNEGEQKEYNNLKLALAFGVELPAPLPPANIIRD